MLTKITLEMHLDQFTLYKNQTLALDSAGCVYIFHGLVLVS